MSEVKEIKIPVMADLFARGEKPEYLFWVGCAGAYDDRYKKVTMAFTRILTHLGISYAVLGKEETCNGDPARRAGNEMLYLMQAMTVIETLKMYEVSKILTMCPHCFNIFRNEYPDLGGNYEVIHHSTFLQELLDQGKLRLEPALMSGKKVTFHDPCYLGRGNKIYDEPRKVAKAVVPEMVEMPRNRSRALCCGAGGAQMFKEAEKGDREVYAERTQEALATGADVVATACPFCMVMLTDGIKYQNKEEEVKNYDLAELIAMSMGLQ